MNIFRYAGLVKETAFGSGIFSAGDVKHVDIVSGTMNAGADKEIIYEGGLGRAAQTRRPGFYSCEGDLAFGVSMGLLTSLMKWTLGDYEFTTDPVKNIHEFTMSDENKKSETFVCQLGKDSFEHVFQGCAIDSLSIDLASEYVVATTSIVAQKDSKAAIKDREDLNLSEYQPLVWSQVALKVDGVQYPCTVQAMTLNIKNNIDAAKGKTIGSRYACGMYTGKAEVDMSLTVQHTENNTFLADLWGGASGPSDSGSTAKALEVIIVDDDGNSVSITLPNVYISENKIDVSGVDTLVEAVTFMALAGDVTLNDASTVNTIAYVKILTDETTL